MQDVLSQDAIEDLYEFGDTAEGSGYPRGADAARAVYVAMLGLIRPDKRPATLLDLGCGTGRLLDHIHAAGHTAIEYTGLDLSEEALGLARVKHPETTFLRADLLEGQAGVGTFDYVVMNGVFTSRHAYTATEMTRYWERLLRAAYRHCTIGLAFNAISKHVDWERDDLFHLPFDAMASFLTSDISRHFVVRADYGLYEYTTYVYREASGT